MKHFKSGINDSYWLYHRSLARKINLNPFLLANEWVCSNIGWHLRLPIPPFALMRKGGSPRFFASLDFDGGETKAPDMDAGKLAAAMPREATGVVVFDIFVANPDRHEGNVKVDNVDLPTRIEVFDQDYAFWGHTVNCGATRLRHVWDRLGLSKGLTNTDFHKLAPNLSSADLIGEWCNRVFKIPDQFIEDVCAEAKELGANAEEIDTGIAFLKDRKAKLEDIIKQNKAFFPLITTWGSI